MAAWLVVVTTTAIHQAAYINKHVFGYDDKGSTAEMINPLLRPAASAAVDSDFDAELVAYRDRFNATDAFDTKVTPTLNAGGRLGSAGGGGMERVLIIATVPWDYDRALAMWTHLECLTDGIDRVIISAPDAEWSRGIVEMVVDQFKFALENDDGNNPTRRKKIDVEAAFYKNDRYDVGLWCDGLHYHLGFNGSSRTAGDADRTVIYLVNDSAMSVRRYGELTERVSRFALREIATSTTDPRPENATMTGDDDSVKAISLNGILKRSHRGVRHPNRPGGSNFYWIESVYRGLTPAGAKIFYEHSCKNMYIKGKTPCRFHTNPKRCIVDRHEKGLADSFRWQEVDAMYPSHRPNDWDTTKYEEENGGAGISVYPYEQWIQGGLYYWYLVNAHDFPFGKVKKGGDQGTFKCAKLMPGGGEWMERLPYPGLNMLQRFRDEMKDSFQSL